MSAWTHPSLGPIDLIPPNLRPEKVWKHFYDPHEHWERVCSADIAAMRLDAEDIIGAARAGGDSLPPLPAERRRRAMALMVAHHDATYAPAYLSEMSSPETRWTPKRDSARKHRALTPRSVFIVVQLGQPRSYVVTAFRPHPRTEGVEWDEAEFRQHGIWYFQKDTGVRVEDLALAVVENLQRVSSTPSTVKELWWLASAVGYGRLLRHVPEIRDALPIPETALSGTAEPVIDELRGALGWEALAGRLAEALKETRCEDLEAVLADAEELLAVAAVVGADAEAEAFCDEAEMLLPWLPAEWAHIADRARLRVDAFAMQPSHVARLWNAVEDAGTASLVREVDPSVRPASRVADGLIPQRPRWLSWFDSIADLATRATTAVTTSLERSLAGLTITPSEPILSGSDHTNDEWTIRGRPAPGALHHRVFVVDAENPDGSEVTDKFTEADGELWLLNADEQALVVIIAGETPLVGRSLAQVLKEASTRDDVAVRARELQPTQATKARR